MPVSFSFVSREVKPAELEKFLESQQVMVNIAENQLGDKFTDRARQVLSLASEEARRYNHRGVGTEHVLLAIMSERGREGESQLHYLQSAREAHSQRMEYVFIIAS